MATSVKPGAKPLEQGFERRRGQQLGGCFHKKSGTAAAWGVLVFGGCQEGEKKKGSVT